MHSQNGRKDSLMTGSSLSLIHLRYFRDAVLLKGVAAAAKRNYVTPSAISQAIKSLESHFETELLAHAKNQFILTNQGRILFENCHQVFAATESIEDEIRLAQSGLKGEVNFATQRSIAQDLLPPFIAHMHLKYPDLRPKIMLGTTDIVGQWISDRTTEFGISVDNFGEHDFLTTPIYEGRYVFVGAKESKRGRNRVEAFLLSDPKTREARTFKNDYQNRFGHEANVLLEIKSWGVLKRLAESGMGTALIPDFLIKFDSNQKLREVKLDLPRMTYRINAYHSRQRQRLSLPCQVFLKELGIFFEKMKS